jgi:quercetin dioxygenase-like cupin family protein
MRYTTIHLDDIEPAGPGGAVRFVRRELDLLAFGVNFFDIAPGASGLEHDETGSGQEELAFVVSGDGHWLVDGEPVEARTGTFIRFDPEAVRQPVAGSEGLKFVAVGSPRGAYTPRGNF